MVRLRKRVLPFLIVVLSARAQTVFTAAQAKAGRSAYQANCASCHMPDLAGRNEAPQLAGPNFMLAWRARTAGALDAYIQETMPPGNRGGLGQEMYVNLTAFLLEANGGRAGEQALTVNSGAPIGSVATGEMPPELRTALNAPSTDQAGVSTLAGPKGHSVRGEVNNYVPVTDEMLRHPNPADWLMIRGNYQGWSYSPLTQITSSNVGNL